jgi:hypothetical protein
MKPKGLPMENFPRRSFLILAVAAGCNSSSQPTVSPQAQTETAVQDYLALTPLVNARIAEENFPTPTSWSVEQSKPDEAFVTVTYGANHQKKSMTLRKRDGQWAFVPQE